MNDGRVKIEGFELAKILDNFTISVHPNEMIQNIYDRILIHFQSQNVAIRQLILYYFDDQHNSINLETNLSLSKYHISENSKINCRIIPPSNMQMFVKTPPGKHITLDVIPNYYIEDVKTSFKSAKAYLQINGDLSSH